MFNYKLLPELLEHLACPTCRDPIVSETREPIEFGTVRCSCGHYPVVAGVLVLDRNDECNRLIGAINSQEWDCLDAMLVRDFSVPSALVRRQVAGFSEAITALTKEIPARAVAEFEWLLHAKYWEATPKYLAALRLTASLADAPALPTLDLACGFGHLSCLYRDFLPPTPLYLLDSDLLYLTMAVHVLGENRLRNCCMIAMNVTAALPFKPGALGSILNADSFYDFPHQSQTLRACGEALSVDGILVFTHLHNQQRPDEPFQQDSHDRQGWKQLFEQNLGPVSVLSDDALRASLNAHHEPLKTDSALDNPRSYSVVYPAIDMLPPLDAERILQGHIEVNPIFETRDGTPALRLIRRKLTPLFESEHEIERFAPTEDVRYQDLLDPQSRLALLKRAILVRSCHVASPSDAGASLQ